MLVVEVVVVVLVVVVAVIVVVLSVSLVVVVWYVGGYVGLWPWLCASVISGWTKLRDCITSDPRFDVLLPAPVRRVLHWIFRLDSKVTTTCSSSSCCCCCCCCWCSCSSIMCVCRLPCLCTMAWTASSAFSSFL